MKLTLILKSCLAAILGITMVTAANAQVTLDGEPKVAFIYFSPKNDGGWTEAHERARQKTSAETGVDIAYVENVEETNDAVRQVVDLYADRGYNMIVGTSYGFGAGLKEAAEAYPGLAFVNVAGDTEAPNLETFYARTYEAWYLAGMAAGSVSKTNKIGIVAGFPVSIVNWDINAFARGARSINPEVEVIATFANTWYDPVKEKQTAEAMIEQGADVVACNMSSTAVVVAAEEAGVFSVGFQNDMSAAGPNGHLTSVLFHWDKYYTPLINEVAKGNWNSKGLPLSGMELGAADISPLSDAVPADVRQKIEDTRKAMQNGTFQTYAGPVVKQNGDIVVAEGAVMDDGGLWGMDYFVEGIIGTMPDS